MTVTDTTTPDQSDAVSFELDLPHPPARVWRALTEPELLGKWLLSVTDLHLVTGADFTLRTQPQPGWDGTVNCRFLEIEPLRSLSYTWAVDSMELSTTVTFTLTPTSTGTHLALVQSGFKPAQKKNWGGARYGWKMMTGKLLTLLDTTA